MKIIALIVLDLVNWQVHGDVVLRHVAGFGAESCRLSTST